MSYRAKILAIAILGTSVPLLALIVHFLLRTAPEGTSTVTLGVVVTATLIGTGVAIWALSALLRPIVMTSSALRAYRTTRELPILPTGFADEAGTLMADTLGTIADLDAALASSGGGREAGVVSSGSAPTAPRSAIESRVTAQELRRAIGGNEFRLHLQPVIDINLGRAVGAEALIRWQHPGRGLLLPQEFLPVAEASGLIDRIGHWVVRAACAQLSRWNAATDEMLGLAINLSAGQFLDPKLPGAIVEALANSRVSPDRLEIELSETVAMRDRDVTAKIFGQLRDRGVSVCGRSRA